MPIDFQDWTFWGAILAAFVLVWETMAIGSAAHAVMTSRTSQGAIAWAVCLVTFPWITLPAYWIFGTVRFEGYVKSRRQGDTGIHHIVWHLRKVAEQRGVVQEVDDGVLDSFQKLARMSFTAGNDVKLLIDGQETFDAIFAGMDAATDYVIAQYFIVHDDEIGRAFRDRLVEKARAGVDVYFLYDEVGCNGLPKRYLRELRAAGVRVSPFNSSRRNRFQLNFRNHRKIVIADGRIAFVGGLNVGDEYMGRNQKIGPWRDTHAQVVGPAVQAVQLAFLEDWYWATHDIPELNWVPERSATGDQSLLVLPTGPADQLETCGLFFVQMISAAKERVWIASPYFVPDMHVVAALQAAALRNVDVRVILPEKPDHKLVYLSAFSFLDEAEKAGVKIFRYEPGFMHHKVILVDDTLAGVGTANLDNRSFRLNFEITLLVNDAKFAAEVSGMFERDLRNCHEAKVDDLAGRSLLFRIGVRIARLMAPLQ